MDDSWGKCFHIGICDWSYGSEKEDGLGQTLLFKGEWQEVSISELEELLDEDKTVNILPSGKIKAKG